MTSMNPDSPPAQLRFSESELAMVGISLSDAVAERWPRARYVELGAQICREVGSLRERGDALAALHPDNVSLNLADYPVVRRNTAAQSGGYTAPEFAGTGPTKATDVFAVGAIVFYMLTESEPPMTSEERRHVLSAYPPSLFDILDKALAVDPAQRHASAERLEADLMRWALDDHPESVEPMWENPFLSSPEESGPRQALRSTMPPTSTPTKNDEPAPKNGDELVADLRPVDGRQLAWAVVLVVAAAVAMVAKAM